MNLSILPQSGKSMHMFTHTQNILLTLLSPLSLSLLLLFRYYGSLKGSSGWFPSKLIRYTTIIILFTDLIWFCAVQCVQQIEGKSLESFEDEVHPSSCAWAAVMLAAATLTLPLCPLQLKPAPMFVVLSLKQRMAELVSHLPYVSPKTAITRCSLTLIDGKNHSPAERNRQNRESVDGRRQFQGEPASYVRFMDSLDSCSWSVRGFVVASGFF